MEKAYLQEAFQQLSILNEDTFDLNDSADIEDLKALVSDDEETEVGNEDTSDELEVIDPDAEEEDEVKENYIGKVILQCAVCQSMVYKSIEDVVIDDELELANTDMECPYCYSTDGFTVIGQVSVFNPEDEEADTEVNVEVEEKPENEDTDEEADTDDDVEEIDEEEKEDIEESLDEAICIKCGKTPCECKAEVSECALTEETEDKKFTCCICGLESEGCGNNAWPVCDDGRCCDACNMEKVLPARIAELKKYDKVDEKEEVSESFEKVDVETEDSIIHISEEPKEEVADTDVDVEVIAPLDEPVKDTIEANNIEDDELDEPEEDNSIDFDVEDIDEDSFNGLGESYLKKVYENVNSFTTTDAKVLGNKLVLEGMITFNSGNTKKTTFVFEAYTANKDGKVTFLGENLNISDKKHAFTLTGNLADKKLVTESLAYSYSEKVNEAIQEVSGKVTLAD